MEESETIRAVAEAAESVLKEETERWLPQPQGLPAVGQRVRLIGAHPWVGYTGRVSRWEQVPWAGSGSPLTAAVVELEGTSGRQAGIYGAQDWEALE